MTQLNLARTDLTDEGLKHVGEMSWLKSLKIDDSKVTDLGLRNLSN